MKHTVYIRAADGSMAPFDSIREASAELGRALRIRWSSATRTARGEALTDPIEERRQSAKSTKP
jgi:hypothetical protein